MILHIDMLFIAGWECKKKVKINQMADVSFYSYHLCGVEWATNESQKILITIYQLELHCLFDLMLFYECQNERKEVIFTSLLVPIRLYVCLTLVIRVLTVSEIQFEVPFNALSLTVLFFFYFASHCIHRSSYMVAMEIFFVSYFFFFKVKVLPTCR